MIENTAHFIWLGNRFPYLNGLSLVSAAVRGGFDTVVLHHDDAIDDTPGWAIARRYDRVTKQRLQPSAVFGALPELGERLTALYNTLEQPAARANMLRAALLYCLGGVYLDTDIITVRSFGPLLRDKAFAGEERIVFPAALSKSRNPIDYLVAGARFAVRDLYRRRPDGWRGFRHIERHYPRVVNNAVLGAPTGSDAMALLLETMLRLPPDRQRRRYALGTHLLETSVADHPELFDIYPPAYFYPIGPEVSEHWFKRTHRADPDAMLLPETVGVHWYASVRCAAYAERATDEWIRTERGERPICALTAPFI